MKKKIITIASILFIAGSFAFVLAKNKSKINTAAKPANNRIVVPVKVYDVQEDTFNTSFSVNGTTVPAREVKIASEVQGKIVGLYVKNGDFVKAGQTIATLDASVYNVQLASINASVAKAQLDLKRYNDLIKLGGATPMQAESVELQIKSYEAQKKQVLDLIAHMQIRAPFTGKIENVAVELGSFVSYGTVLSQLIDNSSLKIDVYLSEQEAFKVTQEQKAEIRSVVLAEPKTAKVSMISDKADASGKFLTEVSLSNNNKELKAGMLADVYFSTDAMKTGLSIPVSALLASAKDAKVFVVKENHVEQRSITTGVVTSDKVEVLKGLNAGEKVVISGQLNLENGATVSVN